MLLIASAVEGAGFQNPPQGAAAAGQAGAFVAQADDATAITHNPAGLTRLSGTSFLFAPTFIHPSTRYLAPGGETEKARESWHMLPNFYFATDLGQTDWRFGLGVTTPFGQATEWDKEGRLRYEATFSEMRFIAVNPTVAYRVNTDFSLGLGLNYYHSELTLKAQNDYRPFPDGSRKLSADGEGYGYNLGFLYQPSHKHSIGGTFRSGASVKHTGNLSLTGIPLPLGGPDFQTPATVRSNFPNMAGLGYAYRPNERWKVEANLEWTRWSSVKKMTIELAEPLPFPGPPVQKITQKQDWKDTWSPRVGLEFRPNAGWKLWAGYVYLPTPIPDRRFHPSLPDADAHVACLGFGWQKNNFALALSQEFSFPEDRKIDRGEPFDGTYRSFNLITALNIRYRF